MRKAERAKLEPGELVLDAFDLLEAKDVGLVLLYEAVDEVEPKPDRVDIPGGEAKAHGGAKIVAPPRKSKRTALDRPLNAFEEPDPHSEEAPETGGLGASS